MEHSISFSVKLNVHSAYRKEKKSEFKMIAIKYSDIYLFTNFEGSIYPVLFTTRTLSKLRQRNLPSMIYVS